MASTPPAIRPPAQPAAPKPALQNLSPLLPQPSPLPDPALAGLPTGGGGLLGPNPLGTTLAELAAPAAAPAPAPAAPASHGTTPDYTDLFQQSLGASRADINRMVDTALASINHSNQLQAQQVAQIPGQLASIYGTAQTQTNQGLTSALGAQKAAGLQSYMPLEQQMAPLQAALSQGLANRQSLVPMLQAGVADLGSRQRAQAELQRSQGLADLNTEERQYLLKKQSGDLETPEEKEARELSTYRGKANIDKEVNGTPADQLAAQAKAKRDATLNTILSTVGENNATADRGAAIEAQNGDDMKAVQADPDFQSAVGKVGKEKPWSWTGNNGGLLSGRNHYSVEDLAKELEKKGKFRSAAVLRHQYGKPEEKATRSGNLQTLLLGN